MSTILPVPGNKLPTVIREAKIILASQSIFFSEIAASMPWRATDSCIMATDGRSIFFSPEKVSKMTPQEIAGVIVHEVLHCINEHHLRISLFGKHHHKLFNVAADMAINPLVMQGGFKLPTGCLMPETMEDWDSSAEQIANRLLADQAEKNKEKARAPQPHEEPQDQNQNRNEPDENDDTSDETNGTQGAEENGAPDNAASDDNDGGDTGEKPSQDSGQTEGGDDPDNTPDPADDDVPSDEKGDKKNGADTNDDGTKDDNDGDGDSDGTKDDGDGDGEPDNRTDTRANDETAGQEADWSDEKYPVPEIGQVLPMMDENGQPLTPQQSATEQSNLRARIRAAAEAASKSGEKNHERILSAISRIHLNQPPNWIDDIDRLLGEEPGTTDCWEHLSRRHFAMQQLAPGPERTGLGNVTWAIDTSASVTSAQISRYATDLLDLLSRHGVQELRLIMCDTEIRLDKMIGLSELHGHIDVQGGGGTAVSPVFKLLESTEPRTDTLFYTTDLMIQDWKDVSSYPERTIWITDSATQTAPFGSTVRV